MSCCWYLHTNAPLPDRDGLLGSGRPAKVYGQVDGRVTQGVEDYGQGMGSIHGRCLADSGQIQSARAEEQAELRAIVNSTRPDIVFDSAHAQDAA
jgi:hypothetical protein